MRGCRSALAVVALGCSLVAANAGETGLYVSGHGGVSFPGESDGTSPDGPTKLEAEDGYRFGGAVGWIFNRYLSSEVEVTYASHDIDTINFSFAPGVWTGPLAGEGKVTALSGMFNTYLSLPATGGFRPYVGGGIGYTQISADKIYAPVLSPITTDDSDAAFSWQLMAGVGYEIAPNLELGTRYRYQHTEAVTLTNGVGEWQKIPDTEAHSVELTLTWKLDRSEPAPLK